MGYSIRQLATLGVIAPLMAACVKASTYHRDLAGTRAQITAEQQARMNADSLVCYPERRKRSSAMQERSRGREDGCCGTAE